jgi:hypothetical protein
MGADRSRDKPPRRRKRAKSTVKGAGLEGAPEGRALPFANERPEKSFPESGEIDSRTAPRRSQRNPDIRDTVSRYVDG